MKSLLDANLLVKLGLNELDNQEQEKICGGLHVHGVGWLIAALIATPVLYHFWPALEAETLCTSACRNFLVDVKDRPVPNEEAMKAILQDQNFRRNLLVKYIKTLEGNEKSNAISHYYDQFKNNKRWFGFDYSDVHKRFEKWATNVLKQNEDYMYKTRKSAITIGVGLAVVCIYKNLAYRASTKFAEVAST